MNVKKVIKIAGFMAGAYIVGKLVGVHDGAKAVLKKYSDIIPDEEVTVKLIDNALIAITATAKKGAVK